jgi:hypothetical protein
MNKIHEAQKTAIGYALIIPSGFSSFGGINFLTLRIRKPSGNYVIKSLDTSNLVPESKSIKLNLVTNDLDEEGIYDYQVINTTSSAQQIGPVLQFYVRKNIY